jgi:hypothetical protein
MKVLRRGGQPYYSVGCEGDKIIPLSRAGQLANGFALEHTMLYAIYRMGYHGRATTHGFAGSAAPAPIASRRRWRSRGAFPNRIKA